MIVHSVRIGITKEWGVQYTSASYDLDRCNHELAVAFRKNIKETASYGQNLDRSVSVRVIKTGISERETRKIALEKLMQSKWFKKHNGEIVKKLLAGHESARNLANDLITIHNGASLEEQPHDWAATSGFYLT